MSAKKKDTGEKELLATVKAYDKMIEFAEDPEMFNSVSVDPIREIKLVTGSSWLIVDTPLCVKYRILACDGCPVMRRTGFRNCHKTPYSELQIAATSGAWKQIALALRVMRKYLYDLETIMF